MTSAKRNRAKEASAKAADRSPANARSESAKKDGGRAARRGGSVPSRTNDIRTAFLDFFAKNDHAVLPSAPLVPRHDPTLMFTNAGMVPFKNILTGAEKPKAPRAATAQKCVRAGGKHNDLDNVGFTARHHTFFEMLGNFSFGDYFKERAILLAWELLTRDFALDKERLLITVFADDDEAATLWRKIAGFPDEKIIRIAGSDNFWSMGETGPCGPCSEIFYDHGPGLAGGPPGGAEPEGDRFVEIWNLVFMQYEQLAGGKRVDLPHPSIDTGMGIERIAAVLQGTHDNYAIDLFRALIEASVALTGVKASGEHAPSHRIIADHLRASSFLIADGVLPSNEGRGYVLRRIMRRAMRHAHLLGAKDPSPLSARAGADRADGPGLSGARARPEPHRGDAEARGDAFPRDARAGASPSRRRDPGFQARRHAPGRGRLQALRHFRLSLRPHRGCAQGARDWRRCRRLRRRHGAPARRGAEVLGGLGRGRDRQPVVRAEG